MTESRQPSSDDFSVNRAVEAAIRIGLIAVLASWCFLIVRPFINPVIWGVIIAIAVYPLYLHFQARLGNRPKLAATLFTLLALVLLITPLVMLSASLVDSTHAVSRGLQDGTLHIPAPPDSIAQWPLVGERLHAQWTLAYSNLEGFLQQMKPQIIALGNWLLGAAAGAGVGILQFVISLIIAGVLLVTADGGGRAMRALAIRLMGERGAGFASLSVATVRSVAQGVLGVAIIQSILAGIGLLVMGVPAAGVWALLVLLLAVVQLPPLLVLAPIMVYVFSVADTLPAVLFAAWSAMVSVSDSFLKPMFLGRGVDVPMLVILLGAIGGMMLSGIIGLFVGAVVLALGYKLFMAWMGVGTTGEGVQPSTGE